MTDRLRGVIVTFDRNIREDDAEGVINAIKHIRCVAGVTPVVNDMDKDMAETKVRHDWADSIMALGMAMYHGRNEEVSEALKKINNDNQK